MKIIDFHTHPYTCREENKCHHKGKLTGSGIAVVNKSCAHAKEKEIKKKEGRLLFLRNDANYAAAEYKNEIDGDTIDIVEET